MKRRKFLILGSVLGLSNYVEGREDISYNKALQDVIETIASVQQHLFTEGCKIPSARSMNATEFLVETIMHKSYDKDIRDFVIEGAKELESREKGKFTSLSEKEKERALRAYEQTNYGSSWLGRIMTLTMEGIFSDPLYGSNVKEAGWRSIGTHGGFPRPKTRYIEL